MQFYFFLCREPVVELNHLCTKMIETPNSLSDRISQSRLITFLDVAWHLKGPAVIQNICRQINKETGRSVLLLNFKHGGGDLDLSRLDFEKKGFEQRCQAFVPYLGIQRESPFIKLDIAVNEDDREILQISRFLKVCQTLFPYIIVKIDGRTYNRVVESFVSHSDFVYFLTTQKGVEQYHVNTALTEMDREVRKKIRILLLAEKGETISELKDLKVRFGKAISRIIQLSPYGISIPEGPDESFERKKRYMAQFRYVAREIGACRVGLVLSSGGAKGFAHIGVIQALEDNGIFVDYIVGSSVGSYMGACWASGYNGRQMQDLAKIYESPFGFMNLFTPSFSFRKGLIQGKRLERRLTKILRAARFKDLSIPLGVAATNLDTLENKIFDRGDVASAVRASCSIPGICVPTIRNHQTFIDGGITDPLPVRNMKSQRIERIISVSLIPSRKQAKKNFHELEQKRKERHMGVCQKILRYVNRRVNYFAYGNAFFTIIRSIEGAQIRQVERDLRRSDIAIEPAACESHWLNFRNPSQHIEVGRKATEKKMKDIKKLVSPSLESCLISNPISTPTLN